jgi:hypothetical protein
MEQLFAIHEIHDVALCMGYELPDRFTPENVVQEIQLLALCIQHNHCRLFAKQMLWAEIENTILNEKNCRDFFTELEYKNFKEFFLFSSISKTDGIVKTYLSREKTLLCEEDQQASFLLKKISNPKKARTIISLAQTLRGSRACWIPKETEKLTSLRALTLFGDAPIRFTTHHGFPHVHVIACGSGKQIINVPRGVRVVKIAVPRESLGVDFQSGPLCYVALRNLDRYEES